MGCMSSSTLTQKIQSHKPFQTTKGKRQGAAGGKQQGTHAHSKGGLKAAAGETERNVGLVSSVTSSCV